MEGVRKVIISHIPGRVPRKGKANNSQATSLSRIAESLDGADVRSSSKDNVAAELTCIRSILELTAHDMNAVKGGIESLNETEQNLPLGGKDGVKMIVSPKLQYNLLSYL